MPLLNQVVSHLGVFEMLVLLIHTLLDQFRTLAVQHLIHFDLVDAALPMSVRLDSIAQNRDQFQLSLALTHRDQRQFELVQPLMLGEQLLILAAVWLKSLSFVELLIVVVRSNPPLNELRSAFALYSRRLLQRQMSQTIRKYPQKPSWLISRSSRSS